MKSFITDSRKRDIFLLFLGSLAIRIAFVKFFSSNPYGVFPDAPEYELIARQFKHGDYTGVLLDRFIVAPLYPFILSLLMRISDLHWLSLVIGAQIVVSALTPVVIYLLAELWFRRPAVALLSGILYTLNPMMFWYTGSLTTEQLFTSAFITAVYLLESALTKRSLPILLLSAVCYGCSYLLKSPALLLSPFIALYIIQRFKARKEGAAVAVKWVAIFGLTSFALSLPYGLYHLRKGDGYILSTNGAAAMFKYGNSNFGYLMCLPQTDPVVKFDLSNLLWEKYDPEAYQYNDLPQKEKQRLFFRYSLRWIRDNPRKFIRLKLWNLRVLLQPGLNADFYSRRHVLVSRIIWVPIYLLGLIGFFFAGDKLQRRMMLYIFLSLVVLSTAFYMQGRFRNIMMEPFITIYAAGGLVHVLSLIRGVRRAPVLS